MLDPCVTLLLRPGGTVQLGWDPETALVLNPPPGADGATLAGLLRLLDGEHSRPQVMWRAAEHGIDVADMSAVLSELDSAGLILDGAGRATTPRTIRVHGRGPLADAIATGLGRSGSKVSRSGSAAADVDVTRWQVDFVVLADDLVADPQLVIGLVRAAIPHLQVRIRDGKGLVGPLVVPGRTSCLRCAELTRCGYDAEWPHIAAQMLGRVGYGSPATVLATAALALGQLESVLAGRSRHAPATLDTTLEFDLATSTLNVRRWSRHTLCECWQSNLS